MAVPIQSLADGRVRYSDGSIRGRAGTSGAVFNPNQQGSVLGASTQAPQTQQPSTAATSNPINTSAVDAVRDSNQRNIDIQTQNTNELIGNVDATFNETAGLLDRSEANLRSDRQNTINQANQNFETNRSTLQGSRDSAIENLAGQEQSAIDARSSADAESAQLFDELVRSGQQRFGATSAGQAFSALNSREQQRRAADIGDQFRANLFEIQTQRNTVDREYQNGILTLQQQKQSALDQIERDFQNRLLEIDNLRNQNSQQKRDLKLSALQELRTNVFNINLETQQFEQQLALQKQQADIELANRQGSLLSALDQAGNASNIFSDFVGQGQSTDILPGVDNISTGDASAGSLTGQVTRTDEDDNPLGVATPSVAAQDDLFSFTTL